MAPSAWLALDSAPPSTSAEHTASNLQATCSLRHSPMNLGGWQRVLPALSLGQEPAQSHLYPQNSEKEMLTDADGSKTWKRLTPTHNKRIRVKHTEMFRLWKIRTIENTLAKDTGKWIFSDCSSGSINWNNTYGGQFAAPSKITNAYALWPRNSSSMNLSTLHLPPTQSTFV